VLGIADDVNGTAVILLRRGSGGQVAGSAGNWIHRALLLAGSSLWQDAENAERQNMIQLHLVTIGKGRALRDLNPRLSYPRFRFGLR
jgi:hypothetical protein